jgi:hypothetical protein
VPRRAHARSAQLHLGSDERKKTDVAEHPQVFRRVGLLFNETPGTAGLLFIQSSEQPITSLAEPQGQVTLPLFHHT